MSLPQRHCVLLLPLILQGLAGPGASDAFGHEEGVLTLDRAEVRAGAVLEVGGSDFTPVTRFRLVLQGGLREYELMEARSDGAGAFLLDLGIPDTVEPGSYRLVAIAPDGDIAGSVDLSVLEAAPEAAEETAAPAETGPMGEAGQPSPSAAEIGLERSWSRVEWFVIGLLLGGALAFGAALLRRQPTGTR